MNTPYDRPTGRDGSLRNGASAGDPTRQAPNPSDASPAGEDVTEQLKTEGKAQVDQYRDAAADKIDTLADSVKAAASKLEGDDIGHLSGHIADMAGSMSKLSDGLRNKSADQILHDVSRIARENPALFIAGSIAVGFGLTRFARASAQGDASDSDAKIGRSNQHESSASDHSDSSSTQNASHSSASQSHRDSGSTGGSNAGSSESNIPGMVGHPATSGGSTGAGETRQPRTHTSGATADSTGSAAGAGTSNSSINDASLGTGGGSTMATGRSRDPSGRDAGGGSAAAPGALDPLSAPYNTTPEQSNGRKPS